MSEERVVEALKALREADRNVEAAPQVEVRLMKSVRRRRVGRVWMGTSVAALAAAAAIVMLLHARRAEPIRQEPPPKVVAVAAEPAPPVVELPPKPRPAPRRKVWNLHEVDTEFYPLMELAPPFERGELVRVTVPASTMRDVGLFVNASHADDSVQADVLVGQEGLARAIRFVSYQ